MACSDHREWRTSTAPHRAPPRPGRGRKATPSTPETTAPHRAPPPLQGGRGAVVGRGRAMNSRNQSHTPPRPAGRARSETTTQRNPTCSVRLHLAMGEPDLVASP